MTRNPLRDALTEIAYRRPGGEISGSRADLVGLIEHFERTAIQALSAVQPEPTPVEGVLAILTAARPAWTNLTTNQRQLDQDGVEVGVSRQAVDETVDAILAASELCRSPTPPEGQVSAGDIKMLGQLRRIADDLRWTSMIVGQPGCMARREAADNLAAVNWALDRFGRAPLSASAQGTERSEVLGAQKQLPEGSGGE